MENIPFGSLVQCKVTGFKGIALERAEHMNDCVRYAVQPPVDKEGKLPKVAFIEGPDLEVLAPPEKDLSPTIQTPDAFKLGVKLRDRITGFTGVAVVRIKYMHAGDRYGLQPPINDKGEIPKIESFDEPDLEQIDPPLPKKRTKREGNFGPHDHEIALAR